MAAQGGKRPPLGTWHHHTSVEQTGTQAEPGEGAGKAESAPGRTSDARAPAPHPCTGGEDGVHPRLLRHGHLAWEALLPAKPDLTGPLSPMGQMSWGRNVCHSPRGVHTAARACQCWFRFVSHSRNNLSACCLMVRKFIHCCLISAPSHLFRLRS